MQIDSYLDMYLVGKILERKEQNIDKWKHIGEVLARGVI